MYFNKVLLLSIGIFYQTEFKIKKEKYSETWGGGEGEGYNFRWVTDLEKVV